MKQTSVFIDSNVWFSAVYKQGTCSQLIQKLCENKWKIVISELVLEEILRNIEVKNPSASLFASEYLKIVNPIVVKNPNVEVLDKYLGLAHTDDLPILVSAVKYRCGYFITGNIKDFQVESIRKKTKLKIMSPVHFLSELTHHLTNIS